MYILAVWPQRPWQQGRSVQTTRSDRFKSWFVWIIVGIISRDQKNPCFYFCSSYLKFSLNSIKGYLWEVVQVLSYKVDGILNASGSTVGVGLGQGMPLWGQGHGLQFWGCQPAHSMVKVPFQHSLPTWQKWALDVWVPGSEDGGGSLHRHRWDDGRSQSSVTEGPCEIKSVCECMIYVMIIIYFSICISALGLILFSLDPTLFFKFFFLGSLNPHILISLSLVWNASARTVSE